MTKTFSIILITFYLSGCVSDVSKSLNDYFLKEPERELITKGLSPKKLYDEAKKQLSEGATDEGIKLLQQLQAAYPSSKFALQAKIDLIFHYYDKEKYDLAIDNANDFIDIYPDYFLTPYAYYLRGISAEDKSRSILDNFITDNAQRDVSSVVSAFNYYLALINKFPNSEYSLEAEKRLVIIRNIIARHELFVAIFYTKKNAHIAAINRCKFIIEKYPNTPSVPAALHLMALNYDLIKADNLAEDARRVLNASYPKYTPHYSLKD